MAKKWKPLSGIVYSTNPDFKIEQEEEKEDAISKNQQQLYVWLEHKHRGGKSAVVIKGFVGSDDELNALAKILKTKCGVGGSAKDGEIIIQGNNREKVLEVLITEGYKAKKSGG